MISLKRGDRVALAGQRQHTAHREAARGQVLVGAGAALKSLLLPVQGLLDRGSTQELQGLDCVVGLQGLDCAGAAVAVELGSDDWTEAAAQGLVAVPGLGCCWPRLLAEWGWLETARRSCRGECLVYGHLRRRRGFSPLLIIQKREVKWTTSPLSLLWVKRERVGCCSC